MLDLLDDPERIAFLRTTDEYYNCSMTIPHIFKMKRNLNKTINSYGLKNKVTEYLDILNPHGYNYVSNDALILSLIDLGYKARKESIGKRFDNPNYIFNVSVI